MFIEELDFNDRVDVIFACDAHKLMGETLEASERFPALGRFVVNYVKRTKRKVVFVIGGDWGDFPSVNPHKSKLRRNENTGSRNHSILGDIVAFKEAVTDTLKEIIAFNKRTKGPKIVIYFLEGNHEHYIPTTGYQFNELKDILGIEVLDIKKFVTESGAIWLNFLDKLVINDLVFSHVYKSSAQRLSLQTLYNRNDISTVQGDNHEKKLISGRNMFGTPRFSYSGGCWKSEENRNLEKDDLGLTVFRDVKNSYADMEWVSQEKVLNQYRKEESKKGIKTKKTKNT